MIYETGLWIAALFGCLALCMGNRTALPLLASFALSTLLCWGGAEFNGALWMLLDGMVIGGIITLARPPMSLRDIGIVVLFIPAWGFYTALDEGDASAGHAVALIVMAQFLLTPPYAEVWAWGQRKWQDRHQQDDPPSFRIAYA